MICSTVLVQEDYASGDFPKKETHGIYTLQGINISHLGKRKIIFNMPFFGGYVSSLEGIFRYIYRNKVNLI